jgi:hypothetical protein
MVVAVVNMIMVGGSGGLAAISKGDGLVVERGKRRRRRRRREREREEKKGRGNLEASAIPPCAGCLRERKGGDRRRTTIVGWEWKGEGGRGGGERERERTKEKEGERDLRSVCDWARCEGRGKDLYEKTLGLAWVG